MLLFLIRLAMPQPQNVFVILHYAIIPFLRVPFLIIHILVVLSPIILKAVSLSPVFPIQVALFLFSFRVLQLVFLFSFIHFPIKLFILKF